jgi:hypothetical protein
MRGRLDPMTAAVKAVKAELDRRWAAYESGEEPGEPAKDAIAEIRAGARATQP